MNKKLGYLKNLGKCVEVLEEIEASSSDGQLKKWLVLIEGERYYLKSSSVVNGREMYECESECICCRVASLMGLENVVFYDLDYFNIDGQVIKVCVSKDFIGDNEFLTYAEMLPNIAKFHGKEKYDMVINADPYLKNNIDNILLFDAVICNIDRHLNNIGILFKDFKSTIPLFDNGASLYSNFENKGFRLALKNSFEFQKCKPFFVTVGKQLNLLGKTSLQKVNIYDIFCIVNLYLSGERADLVKELLYRNLSKLGLLRCNYD